MKQYKTRSQIYNELVRQYITPEVKTKANESMDGFADYLALDLLASIDADFLWAYQMVEDDVIDG